MNRWLLCVVLSGCGNAALLSSAEGDAPGGSTPRMEPFNCVDTCEHVKAQLDVDFGVPPSRVDCPRQFGDVANTCAACSARFEERYGVTLTCR